MMAGPASWTNASKLGISFVVLTLISSCGAIQNAKTADTAKQQLIGMDKERVLACMGPPVRRAAEGDTEVWEYTSTSGTRDVTFSGTNGAISERSCKVDVLFRSGVVSRLNYNEVNGGLLTPNSQCASSVRACVR